MAAFRLTYHDYDEFLKRLRSGYALIEIDAHNYTILDEGKNRGGIAKRVFQEAKKAGYLKQVADNQYIFQEIQLTIFDFDLETA